MLPLPLEERAGHASHAPTHPPPPPTLGKHMRGTGGGLGRRGGVELPLKLSVVFLVCLATLLIAFPRLWPKSMEN